MKRKLKLVVAFAFVVIEVFFSFDGRSQTLDLSNIDNFPLYTITEKGDTLYVGTVNEFRELAFAQKLSIDLMKRDSLNQVIQVKQEVYNDQLWLVIDKLKQTNKRKDEVILRVKQERGLLVVERNGLVQSIAELKAKNRRLVWLAIIEGLLIGGLIIR